jgi:hypothetical protein
MLLAASGRVVRGGTWERLDVVAGDQLTFVKDTASLTEAWAFAMTGGKLVDQALLVLAIEAREQCRLSLGVRARGWGLKEAGLDQHVLQVSHERLEHRLLSRQWAFGRSDQGLGRLPSHRSEFLQIGVVMRVLEAAKRLACRHRVLSQLCALAIQGFAPLLICALNLLIRRACGVEHVPQRHRLVAFDGGEAAPVEQPTRCQCERARTRHKRAAAVRALVVSEGALERNQEPSCPSAGRGQEKERR